EDSLTKLAQQEVRSERSKELEHRAERIKETAPRKTQRALDLATEKESSAWLTVLPLQDLGFNLNKREFRYAVKLRYDWPVEDIPSTCACGEAFTVDHSMICKLGDIFGEHLNRGYNKAQDARLDIHARGFWERHRSAFFDVRVCHPNAVSYRDLEPQQIYLLDIEHGTFTPLVFTTTGGMGKECLKYHSRLAQLIAIKKGEQYAKTISWIRTRTSFALLRSALVCLRGSRTRIVPCDIKNVDIDVEVVEGAIKSDY
ncbi:unnamed protein product, partial [Porites lobata]